MKTLVRGWVQVYRSHCWNLYNKMECCVVFVAQQRGHWSFFLNKVHVLHPLLPPDCEKRHNYCEWLLAKVEDDPRILDMTFVSDEACYHLAGHVSSQNSCIWSTEMIPMQPMKLLFTLSRLKYGMQCLAIRLFGPFSPKTLLTRSAPLVWIPRTPYWKGNCPRMVPTRQRNVS
jgi:hypothetical protein